MIWPKSGERAPRPSGP